MLPMWRGLFAPQFICTRCGGPVDDEDAVAMWGPDGKWAGFRCAAHAEDCPT